MKGAFAIGFGRLWVQDRRRGNKSSEGDRQSSPTMGALLSRMLEVFYTKKLEVVLVGLENRSARLLLLAAVP